MEFKLKIAFFEHASKQMSKDGQLEIPEAHLQNILSTNSTFSI